MNRDKRVQTLEARHGQVVDPVTTIEIVGVLPTPDRATGSVLTCTIGSGNLFTLKGTSL